MIEYLFFIFLILSILLCLQYLLLIGSYCYGWINAKPLAMITNESIFVSVIIPARNEEQNIINCLTSIINQRYPNQQFELIVIDDSSTDTTNKKIQQFCEDHVTCKLITLIDKELTGKKNAIRKAVEIAKGELIVTTDADCIMGDHWLSTIVACYKQSGAKMIVGPVSFYDEKTIFEKMQSLEFMSLIACGGGSLYFNKAIMCNGANLAYTKQIFNEVNGYEGIDDIASGDDVLLMYKIQQCYPKGIHFLKHTDAIVYTKAKSTLKEFIEQRKRWASKGFKILNTETKYVSLIVYLFNCVLIVLITGFFCLPTTSLHLIFFEISLIIIGIKCIIDFLLLFLAASFFKKKIFLVYFLPEQFIYILYIVVVGLFGIKRKYKWKDRNIN